MADIEKILEAAEYCLTNGKCTECKFSNGRMFATCRYLMEDAIAMLKEQEHKDRMFHALEDDWKRLNKLLKEQEAEIERLKGKFKIQEVYIMTAQKIKQILENKSYIDDDLFTGREFIMVEKSAWYKLMLYLDDRIEKVNKKKEEKVNESQS